MNRVARLLEEYGPFGVSRGSTILFYWSTAIDIVSQCERSHIHLLGVEGFYLTAHETYPAADWILDLSAKPDDYHAARHFLEQAAGKPLFFELVFDDPKNG